MSSETITLLQRLIRNECVNTGSPESGQEHRSVATLQDFFGVEGRVFEPAPGRQSLVYRVAGADPEAPSLALVPHLDVVPADPDGWTQSPFGAEVVDGYVYGRGALDMLNITAAFARAARPYIRGDIRPRGDLVFAAVADEEAGGRYGAHHLVKNHWDLVGADYLLTELAFPKVTVGTGDAVPVSFGEKGSFFTRLKATGAPGHGSAPYGANNALEKLMAALGGVFETPQPVSITPEWVDFVGGLGLEPDLSSALTDPGRVDDAIDSLAVDDPGLAAYAHAATHLTISPNQALAGTKSNVIPHLAKSILDIRSLAGMDRQFVDSHLRKAMGEIADEVEIKSLGNNEASISPVTGPLWEAIADGVEEIEGHRHLMPTLLTAATDARFWRRRGTIAHGVGLFGDRMGFSEMLSLFHGHDERVSVESVDLTTALYERILRSFLGSTAG